MKSNSNSPTVLFPSRKVLWPCSKLQFIPSSRLCWDVQAGVVGEHRDLLALQGAVLWLHPLSQELCAACCCAKRSMSGELGMSWPALAHTSPGTHQPCCTQTGDGGCRTAPLPLPWELLLLLQHQNHRRCASGKELDDHQKGPAQSCFWVSQLGCPCSCFRNLSFTRLCSRHTNVTFISTYNLPESHKVLELFEVLFLFPWSEVGISGEKILRVKQEGLSLELRFEKYLWSWLVPSAPPLICHLISSPAWACSKTFHSLNNEYSCHLMGLKLGWHSAERH